MAKNRERLNREVPAWLTGLLVAASFGTLLWLERKRPLRRETENTLRRESRNLAIAALSAATVRLTEKPVTDRLTRLVHRKRWGLVKRMNLPVGGEVALSLVLLDYTLYIWHVLTHKVPFLWRFHQAHHVDLDLSASTALRFHFGEMALSVPWRAAQILIIGASPLSLAAWQSATLVAILFHHSNLRLPLEIERRLCRLFVTPRVHGIHHSIVQEETDSNWSTILAWPDYLHGTLRLNVSQQGVTIGVAGYRDPEELTLRRIVRMPFAGNRRPVWELPDHRKPEREPLALPRTRLAG